MRPIRSRSLSFSAGEGLSSSIFWCRRCTEHSRSPRWMTLPCSSATIWISMWRGRSTYRSMYMSPFPNAANASAEAAASRGRLQDHREADPLRQPDQLALVMHHAVAAGQLREPCVLHRFLGADLVAHHPDHLRARADPAQPGVLDHLGELRILAEESVAGMDRVGAADLRRGEDGGNVQVALLRRRRTDADGLVREADVQRARVRGGVDRDGLHAQLARRADDPQRDLSAVGDEDAVKH